MDITGKEDTEQQDKHGKEDKYQECRDEKTTM